MKIQALERTCSVDEAKEVVLRDGGVIITELADSKTMDAVVSEIGPKLEKAPYSQDDFFGRRTRQLGIQDYGSSAYNSLILNKLVLAVIQSILGKLCEGFQLCNTGATQVEPGALPQPLHTDEQIWAHKPKDQIWLVQSMWAVSDFTAQNGATRLVPGSNKWDRNSRYPREEETVPAEMPRGSVMIFSDATYHGAGPNTSKNDRRQAILTGYSLGWLRTLQNFSLSVPPEAAKKLPEPLQELMGYSIHPPFIGYVGGGKHPKELLLQ